MQALIDSDIEFNTMIPAYAVKLGLKIYYIDVRDHKINSPTFTIFKIVLVIFQIKDKLGKVRFLQDIFIVADINMKVIPSIFFLTFNNANVLFAEQKLI